MLMLMMRKMVLLMQNGIPEVDQNDDNADDDVDDDAANDVLQLY